MRAVLQYKSQSVQMVSKIVLAAVLCALVAGCVVLGGCSNDSQASDFEANNIKINVETGKTYEYIVPCAVDTTQTTNATVEIVSKKTFKSDNTHKAAEGYEWQQLVMRITYDDVDAWENGISYAFISSNYYDQTLLDNATVDSKKNKIFKVTQVVEEKTKEFECTLTESITSGGWTTDEKGNHKRTVTATWYAQVPEGYDGMVYGVMDPKYLTNTHYTAGDALSTYYNADDFLLYRFQ